MTRIRVEARNDATVAATFRSFLALAGLGVPDERGRGDVDRSATIARRPRGTLADDDRVADRFVLAENLARFTEAQGDAGVHRRSEGEDRAAEALASAVGDRGDGVSRQVEVDRASVAFDARQRQCAQARGRVGVGHRAVGVEDHDDGLARGLGLNPGHADRRERQQARDPHAVSVRPNARFREVSDCFTGRASRIAVFWTGRASRIAVFVTGRGSRGSLQVLTGRGFRGSLSTEADSRVAGPESDDAETSRALWSS